MVLIGFFLLKFALNEIKNKVLEKGSRERSEIQKSPARATIGKISEKANINDNKFNKKFVNRIL